MKKLLYLFLTLSIFSCKKEEVPTPEEVSSDYKTYVIRQGEHESEGRSPRIYGKIPDNAAFGEFIFTESCRYIVPDGYTEENQPTNKAWGVSFGDHRDNSFRVGWDYWPSKDSIEIKAYIHNMGSIHYPSTGLFYSFGEAIATRITPVYEENKIVLDIFKNYRQFRFEYYFQFPYTKIFGRKYYTKWGYMLFPYIGGDNLAQHDTYIYLKTNFDHLYGF